ncbi:hypothetical protein NXC12_PE00690 (plasmid) [Rhizobium etli]|uniref:Uncharacterized protein n=1 Tax=Rhizobium etli TaxID=29449 RepID=A0AAN1BN47_RHIET|nr:hypothetical protein NXC12_PE00690 [Rhizobium etli]
MRSGELSEDVEFGIGDPEERLNHIAGTINRPSSPSRRTGFPLGGGKKKKYITHGINAEYLLYRFSAELNLIRISTDRPAAGWVNAED